MKLFNTADTAEHRSVANARTLNASWEDFQLAMLPWQKQGLRQTASGYGARLTTAYKINYNGRLYRLYNTIYSNIGSVWFKVKGQIIFVN